MQPNKTLIAFATRWGPQFGGINSFNQDLLKAFAAAFSEHIQTVCVVLHGDDEEIQEAQNSQIRLVPLGLKGHKEFSASFAATVWQALQKCGIRIELEQTVWLGHDRITGGVALSATNEYGGRSLLIHHMSYDHYESFSENSALANQKAKEQRALFERANIVIAVGPLLRDALADMLDRTNIPMLIPGVPDIPVKSVFRTFRGFISGRLSEDARKIKQGHLGVAAFAAAIRKADEDTGLPDVLRGAREPELTLRGVDFEQCDSVDSADAEMELKGFAEEYAGRAIRMHALPFTTDRIDLFDNLRGASVAMMPSWHEGFGLVGWEAIAAGVPLIVSKKSGLYRLLKELDNGLYESLVYPIDIAGSITKPFFQEKDREALACQIVEIAKSPDLARGKAVRLREELLRRYRWPDCARSLAEMLGWVPVQDSADISHEPKPIRPEQGVISGQSSGGALEMPCPTWQADAGFSNSWLLRAEEAVIPFASDREPFLEQQLQWAHSVDFPIAIRLLTGVGGTGKTRLALELCARLLKQGWQTGFLPNDALVAKTAQNLVRSAQNVCLVIDYAETRQTQLLELIKALLAAKPPRQTRILLLARDGGEWWSLLPAKAPACEAILDGRATTGPYNLPQLHDSQENRQAAYRHAMVAFAKKLSLPERPGLPKLNDEHFAHPLYIQMAGLLALYGEEPGSAEAVARSLISHERRYWTKALSALPSMAMQQDESAALLMALATLANGLPTRRDCEGLWIASGGGKSVLKPLFDTLSQLYPGRQGVQALRPDLLGEALVAQCLLGPNGNDLLNAVLGSTNTTLRRASLTVLARLLRNREEVCSIIEPVLIKHFVTCADDLVAVIVETSSPLARMVERAFASLPPAQKSQATGILNKHIQDEIIPLVDLSVLVERAKLTRLEHKTGKFTDEDLASKANALANLSVSLCWQGHAEEAADQARQAMLFYEKLARAKPERFEPKWAHSLDNYANHLSDLGRGDEAEIKYRQALDIREKLARTDPELYEPDWARSLHNYSTNLSRLGRSDEAEIKSKQALDIREKLARAEPERYESDWAHTLDGYAAHLSELGRSDEAEAKARQALEICEKLALAKPERHDPNWARSLINYASHLSDMGRSNEAKAKGKQALQIYEKLARTNPERYESDWARALNNYAGNLSDLGRYDEAEAKARQALEIYEKLACARPEPHEPELAWSLSNYAGHLIDLGHCDEAEAKARRALEIYDKLMQNRPTRFEYNFISSKMSVALFGWLAGKHSLATEYPSACYSTPRQQRMLGYLRYFFTAFTVDDPTETIRNAETYWTAMDPSLRRSRDAEGLLIAGLAESRQIACALTCNWRENLARFRTQRESRLPWWMQEMARRTDLVLE